MHDSTLDLFCENVETEIQDEILDDHQHMIETMQQTYYHAMGKCAEDGRPDDAVSIYEEWCVDGVDPEEGEYVFTFLPDLTDAE
jgi:pentatricopeptide repeat protein|tara:strand:+ start:1445 stop:1696 length:252 start_codon:yes stop_codon:yes gene_type:complete